MPRHCSMFFFMNLNHTHFKSPSFCYTSLHVWINEEYQQVPLTNDQWYLFTRSQWLLPVSFSHFDCFSWKASRLRFFFWKVPNFVYAGFVQDLIVAFFYKFISFSLSSRVFFFSGRFCHSPLERDRVTIPRVIHLLHLVTSSRSEACKSSCI